MQNVQATRMDLILQLEEHIYYNLIKMVAFLLRCLLRRLVCEMQVIRQKCTTIFYVILSEIKSGEFYNEFYILDIFSVKLLLH